MSASARIFISYSHRGNGPEWKAWLLRHLAVFEQHHLLDVWQDGKIGVSAASQTASKAKEIHQSKREQ